MGVRPRRIRRSRKRSRPRARRLARVPSGQPIRRAASSRVCPSRSQRMMGTRNRAGRWSSSSWIAATSSGARTAPTRRSATRPFQVATSSRAGPGPPRGPASDPVQPRPQRRTHPDRPATPKQNQEGRLRGVPRLVLVAEDVPAGSEDHRRMPIHQRMERGLGWGSITGRESFQQLTIRQAGGRPRFEQGVQQGCRRLLRLHHGPIPLPAGSHLSPRCRLRSPMIPESAVTCRFSAIASDNGRS